MYTGKTNCLRYTLGSVWARGCSTLSKKRRNPSSCVMTYECLLFQKKNNKFLNGWENMLLWKKSTFSAIYMSRGHAYRPIPPNKKNI